MCGDDRSDDPINEYDLSKILKSEQPILGSDDSNNCMEDGSIIATSKNEIRNTCNICKESFSHSSQLKRHIGNHENDESLECPSEDLCKSEPFEEDKIIELLSAPKDPAKVDDDEHKSSSPEVKSQSNTVAGDKPTSPNPFQCDICSKTFSRKDHMLIHHNLHTANRQFECPHPHCGKIYLIKSSLRTHFLETHTDKRRFQCDICPKIFPRRSLLVLHKNVHTTNKQFKCEYCDKVFLLRHSLRRHLRLMHIKKVRLSCDICNKTFTRKGCLLKHRNLHTGDEQYVCYHCGKAYLLKASLARHLEMHMTDKSRLQCDICRKRFTRKDGLSIHQKSHIIVKKQYKCDYCDKVYLLRASLKRHFKNRHNVPAAPKPPKMEDFKENIEIHEHDLSEDLCKSEPFEEEETIE